jgi:cobaltochelatase CobN
MVASLHSDRPCVPILFYRSLLLAADVRPIESLVAALAAHGLDAAPLFVPSLKNADAATFVRTALAQLRPAVIVTTTAFAMAGGPEGEEALGGVDAPVLQAVIATTKRAAWCENPRGLGASDLAMHVVLPELDGRVLAGAIAFKDPLPPDDGLAFTALANRPEPDRIDLVADRVAALVRLQRTPRSQRRLAMLIPDYPGAPGRTGYAVGLDVPASVVGLLDDLADAGYAVEAPAALSPGMLLESLEPAASGASLPVATYKEWLRTVAPDAVARMDDAWGAPEADQDVAAGAFRFRVRAFGHVLVAVAPERGRSPDRRADYHDATLPPRHALIAFGLWLRHGCRIDALVHMGAHGAIEWLPGKAVALTGACFPEIWSGPLPVFYPFIVSNPGEAAQAKRRLAAVTIGHLSPPLAPGELSEETRELERLVDEYAQADGLDVRRRERLARLIVETARRSGLASAAGADAELGPDEALRRIDAWLCDLKDLRVKDGLHVYGRVPTTGDPAWIASAEAERAALLAALDGRRIASGPAGAPGRGRHDVLPTGRNLYTADPRTIPTPTATELGRLAADEVVRDYLQRHGEMPRALVIDLWGSASLRTGGEEIAQGLALMGCRPIWDGATGRITGIEVLPCAAAGRPRVDVTWRISGLFRDLFPAQIALIDAAVRSVAARDEPDDENPLAATQRASGNGPTAPPMRIFGTAPGAYGAGVEDLIGHDTDPGAIGETYLSATSHVYGGADGEGVPAPDAFAERVAAADLLLHPGDDPGRDLLEGSADVSFVGGFAAGAGRRGRRPDLIVLDTSDPRRPRARPLAVALARIVRARAVSPRWIEGMMRHGPRGAAELAETVDRLIGFAELTDAVADVLIELIYNAYVADPCVREFLLRENPAAARAIAERLDAAQRRGLWHPRRNDVDTGLAALRRQAMPC